MLIEVLKYQLGQRKNEAATLALLTLCDDTAVSDAGVPDRVLLRVGWGGRVLGDRGLEDGSEGVHCKGRLVW